MLLALKALNVIGAFWSIFCHSWTVIDFQSNCPLSVINNSPIQDQTHPNDHIPWLLGSNLSQLYILLLFSQRKPRSEPGFEPVQGNYFDIFSMMMINDGMGCFLIIFFLLGKSFHVIRELKILFPLKMY